MSTVTRYEHVTDWPTMEPAEDGEYVQWEDYAALRADALRYRWLRDRCDTTTGFLLCQRLEAGEWDAAIDAALGTRYELTDKGRKLLGGGE